MGQNWGQNPYAFSAVIDQYDKANSKINFKLLHVYYTHINQHCRDIFFHSFDVKSYNLKITIVEILTTSPFNQFRVIISNIVSTVT